MGSTIVGRTTQEGILRRAVAFVHVECFLMGRGGGGGLAKRLGHQSSLRCSFDHCERLNV